MSKEIQETVYEIIKLSRQSGLRHIYKAQIKEELLNTPLGKYDREKYNPREKVTKLDRMLSQALSHLTKNERIKKKGKGKYSINTDTQKYRPVICKHLKLKEDGYYCPIKKVYIGDPRAQCELIHGSDYRRLVKTVEPMCPGYTDKKPTKTSIEYAKKAIAKKEKMREDKKRPRYQRGGF